MDIVGLERATKLALSRINHPSYGVVLNASHADRLAIAVQRRFLAADGCVRGV